MTYNRYRRRNNKKFTNYNMKQWHIITTACCAVSLLIVIIIAGIEDKRHSAIENEINSAREEIEYERNVLSDIIRNKLDCEAVGDTTSMEKLCTDYLDNWGNTGDWKLILGNWSYSYPTGPVE